MSMEDISPWQMLKEQCFIEEPWEKGGKGFRGSCGGGTPGKSPIHQAQCLRAKGEWYGRKRGKAHGVCIMHAFDHATGKVQPHREGYTPFLELVSPPKVSEIVTYPAATVNHALLNKIQQTPLHPWAEVVPDYTNEEFKNIVTARATRNFADYDHDDARILLKEILLELQKAGNGPYRLSAGTHEINAVSLAIDQVLGDHLHTYETLEEMSINEFGDVLRTYRKKVKPKFIW